MSDKKSVGGSFAPLAQPVFAVLWTATVLGNTGSFMRDVASSWLMTDLSASTAAVAMVQAAGLASRSAFSHFPWALFTPHPPI